MPCVFPTSHLFFCFPLETANGWPRVIAKNGINLLDDWPFTFTNTTKVYFSEYPDPPQGDVFRYKNGRLRVILPDGRQRYLDIGNVRSQIWIDDFLVYMETFLSLSYTIISPQFILFLDSLPSTLPDLSNTCPQMSSPLLATRFGAKLPPIYFHIP